MTTQQNVIQAKARHMMDFVTETIRNLVESHFPSSTPSRLSENVVAFGIDKNPDGDLNHARIFPAEKGEEDMWPTFLHMNFNLTPADLTQDHDLRSHEQFEIELRNDLNRLITGSPDGEQFDITCSRHRDGTPDSVGKKDRVMLSVSGQHGEGAINVIAYDSLVGLYDRMKANLAKDENADLRTHVPRKSRMQDV